MNDRLYINGRWYVPEQTPTISKIGVPWESTLRTARPQPSQPDQSCEIEHTPYRYVSHCSAHEKNDPECLPCQRGQFVKDGETVPGELEDGA